MSGCSAATDKQREAVSIQVYIAASLKNTMEEIAANYQKINPNLAISYNIGSSGKLQTQIEEGGECDIFFSAGQKQMDALVEKGLVASEDVIPLLENKVVLIKSRDTVTKVTGFDTISLASNLALAADTVPVGQYAREIFTTIGNFEEVMAMEINECSDVTAVLTAIAEESNEVGIVYATDAQSLEDQVEIIAKATEKELKTPVTYPVALVNNEGATEDETAAAQEFLRYLTGDEAKEIFQSYGFSVEL